MYKKILFITDGLENATRAIDKLIEFHEIWDSEILVVHFLKHRIIIPFMYQLNASKLHTYIQQEFNYYEIGQNILDMTEDTFQAAGIPVDLRLIVNENPEEFVKKLVKKQKFDLVVIGVQEIHSKMGAGHNMSISKNLIKKIPCDVLIV
ncbi:MAG: universal stress protein [Promethearchaeota archaeon]